MADDSGGEGQGQVGEERLPMKTVVVIVLGTFAGTFIVALVAFLLYILSMPMEER